VILNKHRRNKIAELGMSEEESHRQGLLNAENDMTDFENIHFVYKV
jgi:MFS transporter, ACS family, allantoate permease